MNQPVEQRCPVKAGGYIIGRELSALGDVDGFVQPDGVYKRLMTDKLGAVRLQQPDGRPAIPFHVVELPKLTDAQAEMLAALIEGLVSGHRVPTYRELMEWLGFASTNAVATTMNALERKTYVKRVGEGRHVKILRHPDGRRFELRAE